MIAVLVVSGFISAIPELFYKNKGHSISSGSIANGNIANPYLLPYRGKNFRYFSFISYFLMDNAYTHSKLYATLIDTYKKLEQENNKDCFYIMECSDKSGGRLALHKTHQNGLSVDFMSPKRSKGYHLHWNGIGLLHYLLEFNASGQLKLNKAVEIDFELMAKHILTLQQEGKKHGVRIKKVILKIDLKDDLFKTKTGKQLKSSGIYFAQTLPEWTDKMHDDHYHIDFELY